MKCLLFSVRWWSSAVRKQQLDNLVLVEFLCKLKWGYLLFILMRNVYPLLDHVFYSFEPTVFDCVEQRCLSVLVDDVDICSVRNQLLDGLIVAFTYAVEDWSLPISVDVIRIRVTSNK